MKRYASPVVRTCNKTKPVEIHWFHKALPALPLWKLKLYWKAEHEESDDRNQGG